MKNFQQEGDVVSVTAASDVTGGTGHLVGSLFGIAVADALTGEAVELALKGVYDHAKTSAQAWAEGAKIYWDNTNKVMTTTASGNTLVGVAVAAAANPSDTGKVRLDGAAR